MSAQVERVPLGARVTFIGPSAKEGLKAGESERIIVRLSPETVALDLERRGYMVERKF